MHAHIDAHGHACPHRRDSLTDMNPSTTRTATLLHVARHRPRCAAAARRSVVARAAQRRRRRPRLLTTAVGRGALTSTLGTLERCQQPLSASPSGLLLVPDAPSAGGDGTVVWNVILMCLGSWNTCNVKSVLTRSTPRAGPRPDGDARVRLISDLFARLRRRRSR